MVLLYFFPPEQHAFYPRCLFYRITGAKCPGCGGLRAMHQLLHGHIANAWHYNALVVLSLPLAGLGAILYLLKPDLAEKMHHRFLNSGALWVVAGAAVLYAVIRNVMNL